MGGVASPIALAKAKVVSMDDSGVCEGRTTTRRLGPIRVDGRTNVR